MHFFHWLNKIHSSIKTGALMLLTRLDKQEINKFTKREIKFTKRVNENRSSPLSLTGLLRYS